VEWGKAPLGVGEKAASATAKFQWNGELQCDRTCFGPPAALVRPQVTARRYSDPVRAPIQRQRSRRFSACGTGIALPVAHQKQVGG